MNRKKYKNNQKRLILLLALSVFVLTLFGCGKKEKKTTEATTEMVVTTETVVVATPAEPEPVMDEEGFYIVEDAVAVVADIANAYMRPDTSSDIFRMLPTDTIVDRTGYNDTWSRVIIQGSPFYVESNRVVEYIPPEPETEPEEETPTDAEETSKRDADGIRRVVIDPCNQAVTNDTHEAVGPNAEETKRAASQGPTGISYGTKAYTLNLAFANQLKQELEARGYEVVLTRDSDDVDISNKTRAEVANTSEADAYIRIAMNQSNDGEQRGVMAACMKDDSPYNSNLYADSHALASRILQGILENSSVTNHGIFHTNQMTAVNWSKIPVAVVYPGYLSNAHDENQLIEEEFQKLIAKGIADGLDYYFDLDE